MKTKKLLVGLLSAALSLSVMGCTNKEEVVEETPMPYEEQYSQYYVEYINPLREYSVYETPESTIEYYQTTEYPGNEQYVTDLKVAYTDSKEKIQSFVDTLKNDLKSEEQEVKDMNEKLIAEGEKTIQNIDARLKKLEEIPAEVYDKTKEDFVKAVNEATQLENDAKTEFDKMLNDMNNMLGIDPNNTNK